MLQLFVVVVPPDELLLDVVPPDELLLDVVPPDELLLEGVKLGTTWDPLQFELL